MVRLLRRLPGSQRGSRLLELGLTVVVLELVASFVVIVIGLFHGVDWTDEAWTASLSISQRGSISEPWAFQYLVHPVQVLFDNSIIALRVLRLILYASLGVIGAIVLLRIAAMRGVDLGVHAKILMFSVTQIGTVLAWSWPPRAFAYNELTAFFVQLVALLLALLLVAGARDSGSPLAARAALALWFVVGVSVGLLFFAKFLASFLLLPVAIVGAVLASRGSRRRSLVALLAGVLAAIVTPTLLGLPLSSYAERVLANLLDENVRAANGHSQDLIQAYVTDLSATFLTLMLPTLLFLVALALVAGVWREERWATGLSGKIGACLTFAVAILSIAYVIAGESGAQKTGRLALLLLVGGASILFFLFSMRPNPNTEISRPWRSWIATLFIAFAPIVVSVGTNNPLTSQFGFGSTVWAGGFALAVALLYKHFDLRSRPARRLLPIALAVVASVLSLYVAVADARTPYRSASFLANNVLVRESGAFSGLFVTRDEANLITWLHDEKENLIAGNTPTITLGLPGALLAFNNSDFASSFIASWWPASYWTIDTSCRREVPSELIVLQSGGMPEGSPDWNDLAATLETSCGIAFPDDFTPVSSFDADNPQFDVTIWQLTSDASTRP